MAKMPKLIKAKIKTIKAGNFNHEIHYVNENFEQETITTPLINALGLGQPTDLTKENAPMKTSTSSLWL